MVLRRSEDGGKTWLPLQVLVPGVGKEALMRTPAPSVDRTDNRIVLFCVNVDKFGPFHHQHFVLTSADSGRTWSKPVDIGPSSTNHNPQFISGPGIGIQARSGRIVIPGYVGEVDSDLDESFYSSAAYSDDHGKTWTFGAPCECVFGREPGGRAGKTAT